MVMKKTNMNIKKCIIIIFILTLPKICMAGLNLGLGLFLENDEIDESIKQEIHLLNSKTIDAIKRKDKDSIVSLYMEEYRDNKELLNIFDSLLDFISPIVMNNEPKMYKEYYWTRKGIGKGQCTILSHNEAGDKFIISFEGKSNKAFVSLLTVETSSKEYLLSLVYMKEDGDWRLYSLRMGDLKIAGKSVMDWYRESKSLYEKDFLMPAFIRLNAIKDIRRPTPLFQYQEEKNIIQFYNAILNKINARYTFPIQLNQLRGKPSIYAIRGRFIKNDLCPLFIYVSSFPIEQKEEIKNEVNSMNDTVMKMFPGISDDVDYICYNAYNEPPSDPNKMYKTIQFYVELEKE